MIAPQVVYAIQDTTGNLLALHHFKEWAEADRVALLQHHPHDLKVVPWTVVDRPAFAGKSAGHQEAHDAARTAFNEEGSTNL